MALYTFGFSNGFPVLFGATTSYPPGAILPPSLDDEPGIIRFANKRQREMTNVFNDNSAEAARVNGVVLILQQPGDGSSLSGVVSSPAGRTSIYGKTSRAVRAYVERRNLDVFGNVIFPQPGPAAPEFVPPPPPSPFFKFRTSMPIPTNGPSGPFSINRVYTAPTLVPSDVASLQLNMANRNNGAANAGIPVTSSLALYTSDGTENPLGTSLGDATLIMPPDGTFGSAQFSNVVTGSDGKVVLLYSFPDPIFFNAINITYGQYNATSLTVDPPPSWDGPNPNPNFWIELEYQTAKKRVVVFGDSISQGYNGGSDVGFSNAAWNQVMRTKDWAVDIMGIVQFGSYQNYAIPGTYPNVWDRVTDIISGSTVVLQLGTNDLVYNDLGVMQTASMQVTAYAQSFFPKDIYAWTVPPQAGYPGTNVVRVGFNTWLKANYLSLGLKGIYDAALGVSAGGLAMDSDPNTLDPSVDSGDQTHPSIAGQTVIKNGWIATIV